jgi:hypothetical protein
VDKLLKSPWWLGGWIAVAIVALVGLVLLRRSARHRGPSATHSAEPAGASGDGRIASDCREPLLGFSEETNGACTSGVHRSAPPEDGRLEASNGQTGKQQKRHAGLLRLVSKGSSKRRNESCSSLPAVDEGPEGGGLDGSLAALPARDGDTSSATVGSFAVRVHESEAAD